MLFYTMIHGMSIGYSRMNDLKSCYKTTQTLCAFPTKCVLYGTVTIVCRHQCLTSTSCTTMSHLGHHIFVDLIFLNTSHRLVKLFTTMTNLNKYILFFVCFMNRLFFCFSNVSFFELMCRGVEFDHVKPNLVHKFFCIQGIGIIPLK